MLCIHAISFRSIPKTIKLQHFTPAHREKSVFSIFFGYYRNAIKLKPFANENNDRKYCWNISRYRFNAEKSGVHNTQYIECMRQHENLCVSLKAMKCTYIFSADSHRFINQSVLLRNDERISVHFECSPHQADSVIIYLLFFRWFWLRFSIELIFFRDKSLTLRLVGKFLQENFTYINASTLHSLSASLTICI